MSQGPVDSDGTPSIRPVIKSISLQSSMEHIVHALRCVAIAIFSITLALLPVLDIVIGKCWRMLRDLCITVATHYKVIDQYLIERLSSSYVQIGAVIALVTELAGIFGVRAHGPVTNVLSLIWVAIVPVTIIFHLAYRNAEVKKFCDDAAVKLLVTVAMLMVTWYSHESAATLVTKLMAADSSRFTAAVSATTFFGVVGLVGVVVAGMSFIFLFLAMALTFFAPSGVAGEKRSIRRRFADNSPRVLPFLLCLVAMVAVTPETILGGTNVTSLLAARIAYEYDLSDRNLCGKSVKEGHVLLLLDNPKRAIQYTANDFPDVPITFASSAVIENALPVNQGEVQCK
jgi:hypothetical protein